MKFQIEMNRANDVVSGLKECRTSLEECFDRVAAVRRDLDCLGPAARNVSLALTDIQLDIQDENITLVNMQNTLHEAVRLYRSCEQKVSEVEGVMVMWAMEFEQWEPLPTLHLIEDIDYPDRPKWWPWFKPGWIIDEDENGRLYFDWGTILDETFDLAGAGGLIGSGLGLIGKFAKDGVSDAGNWVDLGKFANDFIGKGADAVSKGGTKAAWKDALLGLDDGLKGLTANGTSFGDVFKSSWNKSFIDDLGFNGAATTADKVKVGTAWAGHLLTVIGNGVDNYDEYQKNPDMSVGRAVTETIVESGVDIALGAAATAAVSAGAVALGFTAAPAIAVGAVAAGVVWAANGVCKWVTGGKDIGEVVADTVCDIGEGAVKVAKDIGDGIKKAGNAVKNGLSSAWRGICGAFG